MSHEGNLFVPLGGWGRNVNHDPRSRYYRAARMHGRAAVEPVDVGWNIHIAPMDQGDLGRCVPTAGVAMLATDPFFNTLDADLQRRLLDPVQVEVLAIELYRAITRIDPFMGAWEPDDTGSDGLSLFKLFRDRGWVSGSEHVMGMQDAHAAIQKGPFPVGISWLSGMYQPRTDGTVTVSGRAEGGHEVLCYRYDKARDLWWFRNSWGAGWGKGGDFAFDTPGYQKLMDMQADGTPMVPVTEPAPVPVPEPDIVDDSFPDVLLHIWALRAKRRIIAPRYERLAAEAYLNWRQG